MTFLPSADCGDAAVEGVRFRRYRSGAASANSTPALLLHGIPQTAVMWRDLLPELATDRVVVAPDLKGLGRSEVAGPYDIPTLVRELAALILHEVDGPVDVVGHDWGGSLAIALAADRPDLVRRLVVISAPRQIDIRRAPYLPLAGLPVLPEAVFALGGRELVRRIVGYAWAAPQPLPPEVLEHYAGAYADPARVTAMLGYYRAAIRGSVLRGSVLRAFRGGPAGPAPAPTPARSLVVWGSADPVMPIDVGETVVRDLGPRCTFLTVPGVGHFPVEEASDIVVPAIAEFLRAE